MWGVGPFILFVIALALAIISKGYLGYSFAALSTLSILSIAVIYIYQREYFRKYFYDLTSERIIIRKGVIGSKETSVPLNKIQDIYLDQDLFDRLFRLWDLHISSATQTSAFEAHIDGVSEENARTMRSLLMGETMHKAKEEVPGIEYLPNKRGLVVMGVQSFFALIFISLFIHPLFFILLPLLLIWNYLEFSVIRYELREDGVYVRTGFITPRESILLYRNIQDVEENRGIPQIILGVTTLNVKTMTAMSASGSILKFLPQETANEVREKILKQSHKASEEKPPKAASREVTETAVRKELAEVEEPIGEIIVSPYPNHFIKDFIVHHLINTGLLAVVVASLSVIFGLTINSSFFGGIILAIILFFAPIILSSTRVIINALTFKYSISNRSIAVYFGLFNKTKKQINFNKIQDLVVHITFPQSFVKLASLKLETGSKEAIQGQRGSGAQVQSMSMLSESIPYLDDWNAVKLRDEIAAKMKLSLSGIAGENPLVKRFPLETIKPLKKTLWWVIVALVISMVTLILVIGKILPILGFISILGLLFVVVVFKFLYEKEYYKRYFYDLNQDVLVIKKGVFGSREIVVPFAKIQDVFVDQDILDRYFGLRDLYVSTVTGRSMLNAHIDGVNPEKAEEIALMILERMK
ncbi:MAG: PH domain-containing protein [Candidatus Altiarchaeota archaeon]